MKRLSVKTRMVLFTAMILVLMALFVYGLLMGSSRRQAASHTIETLKRASHDAEDEVELRDDMFILDQDIGDIDYANILLYDETGRRQFYGPVPAFDAPLLEGEPRRVEGDDASTWYVYDVLKPLSADVSCWIRTSMRMDSLVEVQQSTQRLFLFMVAPLCILGILGGYLIARHALAPIAKMAETAERIADGDDLDRRIGITSRDEFGRLSAVLDDMLERLSAAFRQEKRFTADASHELRTPLAVIKTQCELGLAEGGEPREALAAIAEQEKRLSRLVKDLLMLSRMDAGTEKLTLEEVDLALLAESVAEELSPAAEARGIQVSLRCPEGVSLQADEMLLMRMLINLFENAVRFANTRIDCSLVREEGRIVGTIADDGPGIPEEALPHLFERFYQADRARGREGGSSGLGLSMVEWILHAHGGEITAGNGEHGGAVFRFTLPA